MKRKFALLLAVALSISLLVGCGGGSQEEAPSGDNSSVVKTTNNTVKKSNTFSGYLSNEDTIVYKVSAMDKAKTPETVYFFRDGKVTIIPGDIVGLTLGELSNMTDDELVKLHIGKVLHKTHIEVGEEGTRAAAVTAVIMLENAVIVEGEIKKVFLDRPFVYMIVDGESEMPLFMGVVRNI